MTRYDPKAALELDRWREVMGRRAPGEPVIVTVSCTVGRTVYRFDGAKLPTGMSKIIAGRKAPKMRAPKFAVGATLRSSGGAEGAYARAMATGDWSA